MAEYYYDVKTRDKTRKGVRSAQKNMGKLNKSAASMAKNFAKAAAPIAGVTAALALMKKTISESVAAYGEQVQAEEKLAAALRATGDASSETQSKLQDIASQIQEVTTVGDEMTLQIMQMAKSQGIATDKIEEATRGAIGLSRAFGMDAKMAIKGVANAFNGTFTTLQRYIPELRTAETETEKMAILQEKMASGFEVAKAEADNAYGALEQYRNAAGDLKEQMGESLLKGIQPFVTGLTNIVSKLTEAIEKQRTYNEVVAGLGEGGEKGQQSLLSLNEAIAKHEERINSLWSTGGESGISKQAREWKVAKLQKELELMKEQRRERVEALRWQAKANGLTAQFAEIWEAINNGTKLATKYNEQLLSPLKKQRKTIQEKINKLVTIRGYLKENNEWIDENGERYEHSKKIQTAVNALVGERAKIVEQIKEKNEENNEELEKSLTYLTKLHKLSGEAAKTFEQGRPRVSRGDTGERAQEGFTTPEPAKAPTDVTGALSPFIGALKDAAGKLEGFAGTLAQSVMKHGPAMGILMASLNRVLGRMVDILNPLINTILEPATRFLDWIADTLSSYIIPVLQMLSPILQTVIAAFKVFSAVIFQPVMIILNILMPAIKVLASVFTWFYEKIIAPVGRAIVKAFEIAGNIVIVIANSLIRIWNGTVAPVLYQIAKAFAWFQNNVIRPVGNAILDGIDWAVNGIIKIIRKLINKINDVLGTDISKPGKIDVKGKGIGKAKVSEDFGKIPLAERLDLGGFMPGAPTDTTYEGAEGGGGRGAQYTGATTINANITINTDVVTGEGGFRELAVMLRDEILRLEELGA